MLYVQLLLFFSLSRVVISFTVKKQKKSAAPFEPPIWRYECKKSCSSSSDLRLIILRRCRLASTTFSGRHSRVMWGNVNERHHPTCLCKSCRFMSAISKHSTVFLRQGARHQETLGRCSSSQQITHQLLGWTHCLYLYYTNVGNGGVQRHARNEDSVTSAATGEA